MRGLLSIVSLFRNEFSKLNNTGSRILDSIYHMTLQLLKITLSRENARFCHNLDSVKMDFNVRALYVTKSVNP